MDPLSITVSAVTLVGVIRQAVQCAERLRAIRQAPDEIKSLLEEVADLSELLKQLQLAQNPPAYGDGFTRPTDTPKGLDWQISRTSTKLSELDSLVEDHASRTDRRRLDRGHWGWAKGRGKANALREELRVLRLNLAASLGATTSHAVGRVETAIERVHTEQAKTTQLLSNLVGALIPEHPTSSLPPFEVSSHNGSLNCTVQYPVKSQKEAPFTTSRLPEKGPKMTRHKLLAMRASEPDKALEVFSRKSTARCKEWCSCACHKKNILRVKELSTIGSFSLAYSGLPWLTAACDQKTCRSRSVPSVAVTFNFPPWVWHRYFSSSFSYTPIRGPEINFKLPRMVDWSSRLWRCGVVGDIGGVQKLYSSGTASPWDVNTLGGSLLHYATDHEHWDLCHFLVREGVTTETEDDFTNSPVSIVWQKILSRTLTGDESSRMAGLFSDTDYLETRQFTILHKIVLDLIPRTLESELEFSTKDLDSVDSSGRTCASWAAARGDSETMGTLLRYGANVNICDGQGASPLHHATSVACINLLVNSGADVNARNSFGHTPLHSICRGSGSLLLLQHLVAIGIDINLADRSGETALANATFNGHTACALYLLEIGADMDLAGGPNMSGDGPVQLAVSQNMHEVLHCLLDGGVAYTRANLTGSTVLHLAARFADAGTVGILKRHGLDSIDASHLDYDGKTARDYIEEREEDAESAIFKPVFEELLQGIEKGRHNELASVHSLETRLAALDTLKSTAIATSTPVSSEDEDYDQEFADDECGHNPRIFFDAIESLLELPPTAEIKV